MKKSRSLDASSSSSRMCPPSVFALAAGRGTVPWTTCVAVGLAFSAVVASPANSASPERPNVVILIADDLAYDDLGCYGHPSIRTPNIDRLAAEGIRFDAAFLTCSSCSPSRCSILTGRYPHSTGAGELHLPLPADQLSVSEVLRDAGYHTIASGKWHLGQAAKEKFDVVSKGKDPSGAGAWIRDLEERPRDRPFFAFLAAYDPHRTYQPGTLDPPHTPESVVVPPIFPDTPEIRQDLAMYYDEVGRFDLNVGKVVAELRRQEVIDNTVVIVMSDNGRPWPHCKTRVNVDGVRTPLVVHWPAGRIDRGATPSLVSSVDLAPTILDLVGIDPPPPPPSSFQGVSFVGVLGDRTATVRTHAFAEHNWHDYRARERAVHDGRFAYIVNSLPDLPVTPPADAVVSPSYQQMLRMHQAGTLTGPPADVFRTPRAPEAFFDVVADPHCLNNLIADPKYVETIDRMRVKLRQWQTDTDDVFNGDRSKLTPDRFDRATGRRLPGMKGKMRPPA